MSVATRSLPLIDRSVIRRVLGVAVVLAGSAGYGLAVARTGGLPLLAIVPAAMIFGAVIFMRPYVGVCIALVAAVMFEQWGIEGLEPITAQTHFFDNISGYTSIELRFSMADLLIVITVAAWLIRAFSAGGRRPVGGPLGGAMGAYVGFFVVGAVVGFVRGGAWSDSATLAELRGPLYLGALYFLAANLVRERRQVVAITAVFVALVCVKGLEGVWNGAVMLDLGKRLEAVTSHEDVVFFDVVLVLALALPLLRGRSRMTYLVMAGVPAILVAELLTQRRVAFIALAAAVMVVSICLVALRPRQTLAVLIPITLVIVAYAAVFWNQTGALAQPVRAVKGIVSPDSLSERDLSSNVWRDIENANIAFTLRELPITGVGLGQEYLFQREPPELTGFTYWRYMTHNAVFWVWLKAGILGFAALWFLFARSIVASVRLVRQLPDAELKIIAIIPAALIVTQVVYSAVDLGLTFSRPMIILGVFLGLLQPLVALAAATRTAPSRRGIERRTRLRALPSVAVGR